MSIFLGSAVKEIAALLESAAVTGPVWVVDNPRLAKRLSDGELAVIESAEAADGPVAAAIVSGLARDEDWANTLAAITAHIAPGGLVILVDRGQAIELSRRALCGGLSDIGQLGAGRWLLTHGTLKAL